MLTNEGLRRDVGLWGLTANIVNVVIGSGIFVLPALVAAGLGAAGILAYLFCGFLISIIMLCFAEVGSKITVTGGAYAYIEAAFGKYFGFLAACLLIFGACLMATAAVANAMADMLSCIWPVFSNQSFRVFFFVALFSGFTIINIVGIKQGITLIIITTIVKLAPLLLLVIWGSTEIVPSNLLWHGFPAVSDIGKVSLLLFFAFQGAESSLSVSGEVKNAHKTIPKGILLSFLIILVFYISIQLVAQGVLGNAFAGFSEAPLAEVASRLMGPAGLTLMIAGASVSMFGYLTSDTLNIPRVLFRSSIDKVIPVKPLAMVHKRYATPYIAVISYSALGCLFAITGEFKQLAILSSASVLLVYLGVSLSVIKLRRSVKPEHRTFRIPGGYAIPILSSATIIWFLSNLTHQEMAGMGIALVLLSITYIAIRLLRKQSQLKS
ncbi:MAG: amino acid permease [Bacteroidales bacterium]|nr:amino acid permease [Bacteroidales bacterium]HOY39850.1 APC family permease [Bacteroidales bacterium]HQP03230.1 APC family permease [Bacteroidales bacterium]